jgi:hypothetical protein
MSSVVMIKEFGEMWNYYKKDLEIKNSSPHP